MEYGQPNQTIFADTLLELAKENPDILVVTSDSRGSGKLVPFGEQLPKQIVEVGIAEQNLVGVAAGLAAAGKKPFAISPACFLTIRSLEQIKNDVAYSDRPVRVVGISAGVSYGMLGSTHHSLHDYAALRCINNIDIIAPADNFETREAVKAIINHPRPAYLRFGKKSMANLHPEGTTFEIGKSITVRDGSDLTFISIGEPTSRAMEAAEILEKEGFSCRVISMHTLRPFDTEALLRAAEETKAIITVEEH
ncbi:MAG: transketolase family protein, partial [Anaerolineae bacterium]|nr:transketolase family protein [Anaerolineae bacterium]